jgi:hypothetical protein
MTLQDTAGAKARGEKPGRQLLAAGLLLGGGAALAFLAYNGIGAAQCLSSGATLKLDGFGVACQMDYSSADRVPALIPIGG